MKFQSAFKIGSSWREQARRVVSGREKQEEVRAKEEKDRKEAKESLKAEEKQT